MSRDMHRARSLLPWAFGLALLAVLVAWFVSTHRREQQTLPLPPRGEASYNPLYALKLSLLALGQRVNSRQRLQLDTVPLGPRDTVVIYSDPRTLSDSELDALFDFADAGGHLVLRLPPWQSDKTDVALADWLPIQPTLLKPACMALDVPGQKPHVKFCQSAQFRLSPDADPRAAWRTQDGRYVFARFAQGDGQVDVVSSLELLNNDELTERPHNLFARQLLAPNWGAGTMHLVYAADMPPLWHWLLDHGWMALLPLLLGLLLWLWRRAQRFGPWLPSPLQARRTLLEHVEASGEHLLRYGKQAHLQHAMRDNVLLLLRRRDPLAAAMEGDTQAALLAARTGLPAASLRAALDTRPPATPHEFRQRIAGLIALRKRL